MVLLDGTESIQEKEEHIGLMYCRVGLLHGSLHAISIKPRDMTVLMEGAATPQNYIHIFSRVIVKTIRWAVSHALAM